jgi:hypothetical protein
MPGGSNHAAVWWRDGEEGVEKSGEGRLNVGLRIFLQILRSTFETAQGSFEAKLC